MFIMYAYGKGSIYLQKRKLFSNNIFHIDYLFANLICEKQVTKQNRNDHL